MNRQLIIKFITDNNNELLLDYYDKTYDKLKDLNSRIDRLTLYLIVVVFIFFIASKSSIQSFQLGPISIVDISIVVKLLPLLFSFLLFDLAVTSGHKSEVFMAVKLISLSLYKQEINHRELDTHKHNFITRLILPFSYSTELSKFNTDKVYSFQALIGFFLFFPFLAFLFLPLWIEFYMLRDIYLNHYKDTLGKLCFWFSIWTFLIMLYYFISNMIKGAKDQQEEFK